MLSADSAQTENRPAVSDERSILIPTFFSQGEVDDAPSSSASSDYLLDEHAVSRAEALSYYVGLPSEPTLLYRTGKKWSLPRGLQAHRRRKELREVFDHPIVSLWNHDLGWKVVEIMDAHKVIFTTIDIVRFKMVEVDEPPSDDSEEDADEETEEVGVKKPLIGPVTIWIGVFPDHTSATVAHDSAQAVLALLGDYQITDVDIDFRESYYVRQAGPQLLRPVDDFHPLADVISPLTPALGLSISTTTTPDAQGTMALYLAKGGNSDKLLGLTCRHVLIGSREPNTDFTHHRLGGGYPRDVILLSNRTFDKLVDTIERRIKQHGDAVEYRKSQIERCERREKGSTDADFIEEARKVRIEAERLVHKAQKATSALETLLGRVKSDWKKPQARILGPVLFSPPLALGVGQEHFTEDWAIFQIDQIKLGDGFQGNKIDLEAEQTFGEFTSKCRGLRGDPNWSYKYPDDGLLPLRGTVTLELMSKPDMRDAQDEPCMLVVKHGNASGTTLGRASGAFSIVRQYFHEGDMSIRNTSMEWAIIPYDSKSGAFSEPGDSGSIIADLRGRVGGMLTSGAGQDEAIDMTYATPFWWLLERIKAQGFPNAHLNVFD